MFCSVFTGSQAGLELWILLLSFEITGPALDWLSLQTFHPVLSGCSSGLSIYIQVRGQLNKQVVIELISDPNACVYGTLYSGCRHTGAEWT